MSITAAKSASSMLESILWSLGLTSLSLVHLTPILVTGFPPLLLKIVGFALLLLEPPLPFLFLRPPRHRKNNKNPACLRLRGFEHKRPKPDMTPVARQLRERITTNTFVKEIHSCAIAGFCC